MRSQAIFAVNFALLLATVAAQLNIPSCALNCLTSSSFGTCSHTDASCLCASSSAATFIPDLSKCAIKNCDHADILSVGNFCTQQIASIVATDEASDSAVASAIDASINAEDSSANAGAYASTTPAGTTPAAATGTGTPATGTGAPVLVPSPTSTAPANAAVGRDVGAVGALFAPFIASAVLGSIVF